MKESGSVDAVARWGLAVAQRERWWRLGLAHAAASLRENTGSKRERERERCGERAHTPELNEEQMSPFLKALEKFGEEDEHNNRESHLSTQHIQNAFKRTEGVRAEANDPHRKKGWHCTGYIVCSKQHWKSLVTPPSNQRRKRYPCADYTVRTQP